MQALRHKSKPVFLDDVKTRVGEKPLRIRARHLRVFLVQPAPAVEQAQVTKRVCVAVNIGNKYAVRRESSSELREHFSTERRFCIQQKPEARDQIELGVPQIADL